MGYYDTGVNLPQLAKITSVQTYYRVGTGGSIVRLVRNNLSPDVTDDLVSRTITDTDGVRESVTDTVPPALRTVWNNVYSYGFAFYVGPGDFFEGARIIYTYTSAGD